MLPLGVEQQHLQVVRHLLPWDELAGDGAALHHAVGRALLVPHIILSHLHLGILRRQRDLRLHLYGLLLVHGLLPLALLLLSFLPLPLFLLLLLLLLRLRLLLLSLLLFLVFFLFILCNVNRRFLLNLLLHALWLLDARLLRHRALAKCIKRHRRPLRGSCRDINGRSERNVIVLRCELNGLHHYKIVPIDHLHMIFLLFLLHLPAYPLLLLLLVPRKTSNGLVMDLCCIAHTFLQLL
mmetsp:Transcript_88097/g.189098  ORF Transcript_88097/g.189098 Transcript_88097/m.189098 type:complete len:238 (+) Transcript_88097:918-1631(+)